MIREQPLLARISDQAKAHLLKASLGAPAHPFRDMLNEPQFHIFYHAPVLVVMTACQPTDWAVEDCALAAENMMLAAYGFGLGTCWIGFAQHWLGTADGKAALGVPLSFSPIAPISSATRSASRRPCRARHRTIRWPNPPSTET